MLYLWPDCYVRSPDWSTAAKCACHLNLSHGLESYCNSIDEVAGPSTSDTLRPLLKIQRIHALLLQFVPFHGMHFQIYTGSISLLHSK